MLSPDHSNNSIGFSNLNPILWANPTCQGNLLKKGHVRKNWKWRWFRLQDRNLFYFQTRDASERPIGYIDLSHYMVKKTPSDRRQFGFGLYSPQYPSYPLAAIDEHDYNKWLTHLKQATKGLKSQLNNNSLNQGELVLGENSSEKKSSSSGHREIGLLKSFTEPTQGVKDESRPIPGRRGGQRNRNRNRSSSSGDLRKQEQQPHTKHLSMAAATARSANNDDDDNLRNKSSEDENLEVVDENDGSSDEEFDIEKLKEQKRALEASYGNSPTTGQKSLRSGGGQMASSPIVSSAPVQQMTAASSPPLTQQPNSYETSNFIRIIKSPINKSGSDRSETKKTIPRLPPPERAQRAARFSKNIDPAEWNAQMQVEGGLDKNEIESLTRMSIISGKKLTTANLEEEFEVRSPEMSPRGHAIIREAEKEANRRMSRSIILMNSIMEELSEETIILNPYNNNQINSQYEDKLIWRAIRRSILPSPDLISLKVKGGNHRGQLSPQEITIIANEEEKEKIRKLKELYINPNDPLLKYNIVNRSIGKGAVGEVFFATSRENDKKVAIKKLQIERRGRDRLPLILREIDIIATSSHPNIVSFHEAYQMEGELWVVMEYMTNGSLYDLVKLHIRGVKLDESVGAYCIREVLKAVQFLHSRKRIHRDIKVDNILVNTTGEIKLADFGTAVQLTFQRLRRTTLAGTPYYMAPELIQRIPYNEKVDIWSVGITVVEMMSGKPPFYDLDPREALDAIVLRGVNGLTENRYSDLIKNFVNMQCLCTKPEDRASAKQLLEHPYLLVACTKEYFSQFLLQSTVLYQLDSTGTSGGGCTIL